MSNEEKNRITTKLGYHKFTIKSHKSSDHIQQVSRDINQYLDEIDKQNPKLSMEEMALLVSLNIQSDKLDLIEEVDQLQKENEDLLIRIKSIEHTMGTIVKEFADAEKSKVAEAKQRQEKPEAKEVPTSKKAGSTKQSKPAVEESADLPKIEKPSLKSGINTASKQLGRLRQTPRS